MKIFEFDQIMAMQNNLTVEDLLFLAYLSNMSKNKPLRDLQGRKFFRVSYKMIISDLPILFSNRKRVYRAISKLVKQNLLYVYYTAQRRLYIALNIDVLCPSSVPKLSQCDTDVSLNTDKNIQCDINVPQKKQEWDKNVSLDTLKLSKWDNSKLPSLQSPKYINKLKIYITTTRARVCEIQQNFSKFTEIVIYKAKLLFSSVTYNLWITSLHIADISTTHVTLLMDSMAYNALSTDICTQKLQKIMQSVVDNWEVDYASYTQGNSISSADCG